MTSLLMASGHRRAQQLQPLPSGIECRAITETDRPGIASAYWRAWLGTDQSLTRGHAGDDVNATYNGDHGDLLRHASFVGVTNGRVVAAILTTMNPPWTDWPGGPFIIDLFVDSAHRRLGIGRVLTTSTLAALASERIGLRVDDGNRAAINLYCDLGFQAVNQLRASSSCT